MDGRLISTDAVSAHLKLLALRDPRLTAVIGVAGEVVPRVYEPGFAGLARAICGQQLSVASARAIWARFELIPGALEPASYLGLGEDIVRASGFSRGKYDTVRAIALALAEGQLDLSVLPALEPEAAIASLTAIRGIGPWTAQIYLLFCLGHPDIFPADDLALQKAVAHALGFTARPDSRAMAALAEAWAPHRGAAALLFWRYFAVLRDKEGIAL